MSLKKWSNKNERTFEVAEGNINLPLFKLFKFMSRWISIAVKFMNGKFPNGKFDIVCTAGGAILPKSADEIFGWTRDVSLATCIGLLKSAGGGKFSGPVGGSGKIGCIFTPLALNLLGNSPFALISPLLFWGNAFASLGWINWKEIREKIINEIQLIGFSMNTLA